MLTPKDVRARLVEAFEVDLIGPLLTPGQPKLYERYPEPDHPYRLALQFGFERFEMYRCPEREDGHEILEARCKNEDDNLECSFVGCAATPVPASRSKRSALTIAEARCRPSIPAPQFNLSRSWTFVKVRHRARGPR